MMKVAAIRHGKLVVGHKEMPVPAEGQVLVKNLACGICGSDLHLLKMMAELTSPEDQQPVPEDASNDIILGHEYVCEVIAYGPKTRQKYPVGQRVCSIPFLKTESGEQNIGISPVAAGAFAEYMLLSEEYLLEVPDHLSTEAASLVEPLAVGLHAVKSAGTEIAGSVALVLGCGPIGLAIISMLKLMGATSIIASDYSPNRLKVAETLGATTVDANQGSPYQLLRSTCNSEECLEAEVVIFECVGATGMLDQICSNVPNNSRVVVAGLCSEPDTFNPINALTRELSIQYVFYYKAYEFSEALSLLATEKIDWKPFITAKTNLDSVPQAFELLKSPDNHTKILIEPWRSESGIESLQQA